MADRFTFNNTSFTVVEAGESDGAERRTISGQAVPWYEVARVSSGQLVTFEPGSVSLVGEALIRDHDRTRPIGVVAEETNGDTGLHIKAKVSSTSHGDEALTLAADGVLKHFSVGVNPTKYRFEEIDGEQVLVVEEAEADEVSLLIKGAYGANAAVEKVAAAVPDNNKEATVPESIEATEVAPVIAAPAVAVRAESFPYTFAGHGPSMIRDVALARDGDIQAQQRLATARRMLSDERAVQAGAVRMGAEARKHFVAAAPGTTTTEAEIVPPGYRGDLFTTLLAEEAPLYSAATKAPISDFTPFTVPKVTARTSLSGTPADEVTAVAAGSLTSDKWTITPVHVMGSYQFSRDLALASNPAIDMIAAQEMEEAWLTDVEGRIVAWALTAATAKTPTYTNGQEYLVDVRAELASFRTTRKARADVIIAAAAEYAAAAAAEDTAKRPLLVNGPRYNAVGGVADGYEMLDVYGVPMVPQSTGLATTKTLIAKSADVYCSQTPVWNFSFDAVPDGTNAGQMNPLVLQITKYSGVAFWLRRSQGLVLMTNQGVLA